MARSHDNLSPNLELLDAYKAGDIDKCLEYFEKNLEQKENIPACFENLLMIYDDALSNGFYNQLKSTNIEKLQLFLTKLKKIETYLSNPSTENETLLSKLIQPEQLTRLLTLAKILEKPLEEMSVENAQEFTKFATELNEETCQFLPRSGEFVEKLNHFMAKAIMLIGTDADKLRSLMLSFDTKPIGDFLLLYQKKSEIKGLFHEHRSLWTSFDKDETDTQSDEKAIMQSNNKSSVLYFYDHLDERSIATLEQKFQEAARDGAKCLYIELPLNLALAFRSINRIRNVGMVKQLIDEHIEDLQEQDMGDNSVRERYIAWLHKIQNIIELAYKNNLSVMPVMSTRFSGLLSMGSQSKVEELDRYEIAQMDLIYNIQALNSRLKPNTSEGFIGLFGMEFSDIGAVLNVRSHALAHSAMVRMVDPQDMSKIQIQPILHHGLFRKTQAIPEFTIVDANDPNQERKITAPSSHIKVLIKNYIEAQEYLMPLTFKVRTHQSLSMEEAVNVCLIAEQLPDTEVQKLTDNWADEKANLISKESLKQLLSVAAEIVRDDPPYYFTDYITPPADTMLGKMLGMESAFNRVKLSDEIKGETGVLFFQAHTDLDSFDFLIHQLSSLATDALRPVKHLYMELPADFNELIDDFYKTGNSFALKNKFEGVKEQSPYQHATMRMFQLIIAAHKNNIRVFAVDNVPQKRADAITDENNEAAHQAFGESNKFMVDQINTHKKNLKDNEGYIGLFGLLHIDIAASVKSRACAFVPQYYLKDKVDEISITPASVASVISHDSPEMADALRAVLPLTNKIILTRSTENQKDIEASLERSNPFDLRKK